MNVRGKSKGDERIKKEGRRGEERCNEGRSGQRRGREMRDERVKERRNITPEMEKDLEGTE